MCRRILHAFWAFRADASLRAAFIRVFAVAFVIALVLSVCMVFWTPRVYSSTMTIEVSRDLPKDVVGPDPNFLMTQFKIIESYSTLTNVIATLHLDDKLAAQAGDTHWTMDQTYAALLHTISVEQTLITNVITISVKNRHPKLAADIADAVVDSYRHVRMEWWRSEYLRGIDALQAKLTDVETKLCMIETNLNHMRVALAISDLDEESTAEISTLLPKYQPFFSLKRDIEGRKRNKEELKRLIQIEEAECTQPLLVIVLDPAKPNLRPIHSMPEIFSEWMFGGTLVVLVAGTVGAWLAHSGRQRSRLSIKS